VHKRALTHKEIIFSTSSNQQVLSICVCLIPCTESETYVHVGLRDGGPVFRAPLCILQSNKIMFMCLIPGSADNVSLLRSMMNTTNLT